MSSNAQATDTRPADDDDELTALLERVADGDKEAEEILIRASAKALGTILEQ